MKKLLAVLLAMMMPLCAAAETYSLSMTIDTDSVLFPMYLRQALLEQPDIIPADEVEACVALMQHLMDGLGLQLTMQADAAALDIQVAGENLLDVVFHAAEDATYLTSSLLPGYALTESVTLDATDEQQLQSACEAVNWDHICNTVKESVNAWLAGLEPTVSTGAFSGDAFEDGTVCTTWVITDSDIAALVSALATEELREGLSNVFAAMNVDAAALFSQFDEKNAAVADADTYMYVFRMVDDEVGNLCGFSLTIYEDADQIATLSLGFTQKEVKLVLGLGLEEQNYWWRFTARKTQRNNLSFLGGTSQEWMADKQQNFSYVSASNAPLTDLEWQCNITKSGRRYLWDASIFEDNDQANSRLVFLTTNGTVAPYDKMLDCTISLGYAPDIPAKFKVKFGPAEAIAPLDPALTLCNVSSEEDERLSQELSNRFTAALMARLIKLLPLDVVMMINQLSMPK